MKKGIMVQLNNKELVDKMEDASIYKIFINKKEYVLEISGYPLSWVLYVANPNKERLILSLPIAMEFMTTITDDHSPLWNGFTCNSEEYIGKTIQGNPVAMIVHGGGIFSLEGRISKAAQEGLTATGGGKISNEEMQNLLNGKIKYRDVSYEIPIYRVHELNGSLPKQCGIILDYSEVSMPFGEMNLDKVLLNPLYRAWSGNETSRERYLKHALERRNRISAKQVDLDDSSKLRIKLGPITLVGDNESSSPYSFTMPTIFPKLDPNNPEGRFIRLASLTPEDRYGFNYGASVIVLTKESENIYRWLRKITE